MMDEWRFVLAKTIHLKGSEGPEERKLGTRHSLIGPNGGRGSRREKKGWWSLSSKKKAVQDPRSRKRNNKGLNVKREKVRSKLSTKQRERSYIATIFY